MKKYIVTLLLIVIYAGLPLLQPGFIPTHDGEYHVIRIYEFFTMLRHGSLFPRWAPGLNSGYGIPLFNFQYSFPNYIGSLFYFTGFGLVDSFKLTMFMGYLVATFACFLWLRKMFNNTAALVGAIVFAFVPYWFVDIYVRGSVGEVMAIACLMIALAASEYRKKVLLAVAVGVLIVSHNILAMLFTPLLGLYVLYRFKEGFIYAILGVCLASYFWIPALMERPYVVGLNSVDYRDHFPDLSQLLIPSWGTGFSQPGTSYNEMSQQVGLIPLGITFVAFFLAFGEKDRNRRKLLFGFLCLFVASFFLMLPLSQGIWVFASPLQLLQYPWRLLSFIIPISGFLASYVAYRTKSPFVWIGIAILSIALVRQYIRPVVYTRRDDSYYLSRREFTDGTSSLGNSFSTIWSPWIPQRAESKLEVISGKARIQVLKLLPIQYDAKILVSEKSKIRVNSLYYPGWLLTVDGKRMPIENKNGLIQFTLPSGGHDVSIIFRETTLRFLADSLSILSLFCLAGLAILGQDLYVYRYRNISSRRRT